MIIRQSVALGGVPSGSGARNDRRNSGQLGCHSLVFVDCAVGRACEAARELRRCGYHVVLYPSVKGALACNARFSCAVVAVPGSDTSITEARLLLERGIARALLLHTDECVIASPTSDRAIHAVPKALGLRALVAALARVPKN